MSHIRRHPVDPTKWKLRYRDPEGRERSKTFDLLKDAEVEKTSINHQLLTGTWVDPALASTHLVPAAKLITGL
jgi:hypothetical protein